MLREKGGREGRRVMRGSEGKDTKLRNREGTIFVLLVEEDEEVEKKRREDLIISD